MVPGSRCRVRLGVYRTPVDDGDELKQQQQQQQLRETWFSLPQSVVDD